MNWLADLADEFMPTNINEKAFNSKLARMTRIFAEYPEAIMQRAADAYILNPPHTFFPKVADLKKFVDLEVEQARGHIPYSDEGKQLPDDQRAQVDAELLAFDTQRGTMRPQGAIEAEIAAARAELLGSNIVNENGRLSIAQPVSISL